MLDNKKEIKICFLIGPEGDFTLNELEFLNNSIKIQHICINPFRLRVETAAVSFISSIMSQIIPYLKNKQE